MSLPSISRHLKVLERAGLIVKGKSAQWRPRRLEPAALHEADAWMAPYREFFDARLARLDRQLKLPLEVDDHLQLAQNLGGAGVVQGGRHRGGAHRIVEREDRAAGA